MKKMHKILWVCDTMELAHERKEQLGGGEAFFIGVGGALAGRGFNEIILDLTKKPDVRAQEWLDLFTCLKLLPGGVIRRVVNEKT